jgi:acetyl-CoA acyltransferase 2
LAHLTATELGGLASKAAVAQLPSEAKIDSVIYGNVLQTSAGISFFLIYSHNRRRVYFAPKSNMTHL